MSKDDLLQVKYIYYKYSVQITAAYLEKIENIGSNS